MYWTLYISSLWSHNFLVWVLTSHWRVAGKLLETLRWYTLLSPARRFCFAFKDDFLNFDVLQCSHSKAQPSLVVKSLGLTDISASFVGQQFPYSSTSSGGTLPSLYSFFVIARFSSLNILGNMFLNFNSKTASASALSSGRHLKRHCHIIYSKLQLR